jgi:hypothetical protein
MSVMSLTVRKGKPLPASRSSKGLSLASLKKKAWKTLSLYLRRQAANSWGYATCYTCGARDRYKNLQAGHAIGGRGGSVLFDIDLIRPQCVRCNIFLRGNYTVFTTKLIQEKGMDWWEAKLASSRIVKKWSRADLEALIARYSVTP